ncbi:hypothetical protein GCM10022378_17320 [Salinicoccus jeotgali]|uniref:HTH marR-type domain-containing protein n=1 Tax=Salinicoccus jeotgali TaxID=381634 RepID=A0ABP7F0W4_9STAP
MSETTNDVNIRNVCRYIFMLNAKIDHLAEFKTELGTLSREQLYIVEMISEEPGLTQKTIIGRLNKEQTSVSRAVQTLVDQGYIAKRRNENDMRASHLEMTDAGSEALAELEPSICELSENVVEELNDEEKRTLMDTLRKIQVQ